MSYANADALNDALVAVMNAKTGLSDTDVAVALPKYVSAFNTDANDYTDATVSAEITARNTAISTAIATEVTNRNTSIIDAIDVEIANRDTAISTSIDTEVTNRNTAISTVIATEVTNRNTAISTAIATEVTNRGTAIDTATATEATNRDTAISTAIDNEVTERNIAIDTAAFTAEAAGGVATARLASEYNAFKASVLDLAENIALIPSVTTTRVQNIITHVLFVPESLDVTITGAVMTNSFEKLGETTLIAQLNALKVVALNYNNILPPDNGINVDYAV